MRHQTGQGAVVLLLLVVMLLLLLLLLLLVMLLLLLLVVLLVVLVLRRHRRRQSVSRRNDAAADARQVRQRRLNGRWRVVDSVQAAEDTAAAVTRVTRWHGSVQTARFHFRFHRKHDYAGVDRVGRRTADVT